MATMTQTMREALAHPNPCDGGDTCPCAPGAYYVSAIPDGAERFYLVAGPYATHNEALAHKRRAQDISEDRAPRSFWWAWGVCVMPTSDEQGILNRHNLI